MILAQFAVLFNSNYAFCIFFSCAGPDFYPIHNIVPALMPDWQSIYAPCMRQGVSGNHVGPAVRDMGPRSYSSPDHHKINIEALYMGPLVRRRYIMKFIDMLKKHLHISTKTVIYLEMTALSALCLSIFLYRTDSGQAVMSQAARLAGYINPLED